MNNKLFEEIYSIENLFCAWKKAKHIYDTDLDFIFQTKELSEFEANLDDNLKFISDEIKNGQYSIGNMIPLWLPKVSVPNLESRQNFCFSVKDQVVWLAVINIIGPLLDNKMPYWSFGHRLYMPIWKEDSIREDTGEEKKITRFGFYNSASPKTYRNWSVSWPLFRKAVSISVKSMVSYKDYSEEELEDIENNNYAPESFKIKYWEKDYWKKETNDKDVYYATIDLKRFYPNLSNSKILCSDVKSILNITDNNDPLKLLIEKLLDFHIDKKYIENFDEDSANTGIDLETGKFSGIPTGLFVAGFLANIAMLPIDKEVYIIQNEQRRIAHFRFVDDHVFLAYSFEELCKWIADYKNILNRHFKLLKINDDKIEPVMVKEYLFSQENKENEEDCDYQKTAEACKLNVELPSPFTTLTLRKLSGFSSNPFELLDDVGKKELLNDIEHILSVDFPNDEIRKDTRVSWAASLILRLVPLFEINVKELYKYKKDLELIYQKLNELKEKNMKSDEFKALSTELDEMIKNYEKCKELNYKSLYGFYQHIFSLILKALIDNIAKPKLWKKCIDYCRITGFDGIIKLLDILKDDTQITLSGKQYIFNTILFSLIKNVMISIKIYKSEYFTEREKLNTQKFITNLFSHMEILNNANQSPLHSKYSSQLLKQLSWSLAIYNLECGEQTEQIEEIDYEFICFLWQYLPLYISHKTGAKPPEIIKYLLNKNQHYDNEIIQRKILLMFPQALEPKKLLQLSENSVSFVGMRNSAENHTDDISLQELFMEECEFSSKNASYVCKSEWTKLKILQKVIDIIDQPEPLVFDSIDKKDDFKNCAPCNFFISKQICKSQTWNEIAELLKEDLKFNCQCKDYRFDSTFYNISGNVVAEKRNIYSCAVLLLTLLSESLDFDPLIGRGGMLERNYKQLLMKINDVPVSSYTRAILIGALSDKSFELQNYTSLDDISKGRTEDALDSPIKINSLADFRKELNGAIHTLETYQLSLQNQLPRQLIPLSLKNLTKNYNPYNKGDEINE